MATTTENLGMTLPDTTDPVDVTVLNGNFSTLDTFAGQLTEKDTAQDTTIAKLVDAGAKNLLKNTAPYGDLVRTNLTFTHNDDDTYVVNATSANTANTDLYVATDMPIKAGTYVLSGCPEGGNNTNTFKLQITGIGYDLGEGCTFTIAQDTTISVYIMIWNGYVPNGLIFRPMICTAENYAISPEFVPYAPSNRELYEEVDTKVSLEDILGIGTVIASNADMDSLTDIGKWYCQNSTVAATVAHAPFTKAGYFGWTTRSISPSDRYVQIAISNDEVFVIAKRRYYGTWGAWSYLTGTAVT